MCDMTIFNGSTNMEGNMDRLKWSHRRHRVVAGARAAALCLLLCLAAVAPAAAQFDSGSIGVHGSSPPFPTGTSALPNATRYLVWNMSTGLIRYCSAYDTTARPETCTTEVGTGQIPGIP